MPSIFRLQTCHGTTVALGMADRRLTHQTSNANFTPSPLWLLANDVLGSTLLPFGFDTGSGVITTAAAGSSGEAVMLQCADCGEGVATLRSMSTGRFMAALPDGTIELNRTAALDWEKFRLESQNSVELLFNGKLTKFLDDVQETLKPIPAWSQIARDILAGSGGVASSLILDVVWPLLTLSEFDDLALEVAQRQDWTRRLAALYPDDYWANKALPDLLSWINDHRRTSRLTSPAPVNPLRRFIAWPMARPAVPHTEMSAPTVIGPDLDHLARDGFDGRLMSFAHACNASLRRAVPPLDKIAIVATARSEGIYLLEWIAYHRIIGVDSFFLYSNDNDDGSDELLRALHHAGIIHWTSSKLEPGTSAQNKAYGHALNVQSALLDHRWALFIDLDEFFVFDPNRFSGLSSFARFQALRQTDAVGLNWVMVGSSGQAGWNDAPLTRRNLDLQFGANPHIKVLLSPRNFIQSHPHFPFTEERRDYTFRLADGSLHEHRKQPQGSYHAKAFTDDPSDRDASVYHYFYKSVDEFIWKSSRNRGDYPMSHEINFRSLDRGAVAAFLEQHKNQDVRHETRIHDCAPGLESEIESLRNLPGVRDAERAVQAAFQVRLEKVKTEFMVSPEVDELEDVGAALRELVAGSAPIGETATSTQTGGDASTSVDVGEEQ